MTQTMTHSVIKFTNVVSVTKVLLYLQLFPPLSAPAVWPPPVLPCVTATTCPAGLSFVLTGYKNIQVNTIKPVQVLVMTAVTSITCWQCGIGLVLL